MSDEEAMSLPLRQFVASVNFKAAVALKLGEPVLNIIAALEKIAADMEAVIEAKVESKGPNA